MGTLAQLRSAGLTLSAQGETLLVEPRSVLTDELRQVIRASKPLILRELAEERQARIGRAVRPPLLAQESARRDVIARLRAHPEVKRAFVTRHEGDVLIVTLAVRGVGTCELAIAADRVQTAEDYAALVRCLDVPEGSA